MNRNMFCWCTRLLSFSALIMLIILFPGCVSREEYLDASCKENKTSQDLKIIKRYELERQDWKFLLSDAVIVSDK